MALSLGVDFYKLADILICWIDLQDPVLLGRVLCECEFITPDM